MKDHAHLIISLIGVTITIVGIIAAFSNAFDRVGRHQITLEDHEKRLDTIERDSTTNEKLQKLKESVDFMNWRMDSVMKQLDQLEKKRK